ncbi:MAG: hypothetical protein WBM50_13310, partial [Acidimicrobiales bacterium]
AGAHEGRWKLLLEVDRDAFGRHLRRLKELGKSVELELAQAHGLRYSANVHVQSGVRVDAELVHTDPRPGGVAKIGVSLDQSGLPLGDARVLLEVRRPDGKTHVLEADTDGDRHHIELATDQVGVYRCRVMARGRTLRGVPFTRERVLTVPCWDPDRLAPDPDPPRQDRPGRPSDPPCRKSMQVLVDLLAEPNRCTKELAVQMQRRGYDYREAVACIVECADLEGGGRSPGRIVFDPPIPSPRLVPDPRPGGTDPFIGVGGSVGTSGANGNGGGSHATVSDLLRELASRLEIRVGS